MKAAEGMAGFGNLCFLRLLPATLPPNPCLRAAQNHNPTPSGRAHRGPTQEPARTKQKTWHRQLGCCVAQSEKCRRLCANHRIITSFGNEC